MFKNKVVNKILDIYLDIYFFIEWIAMVFVIDKLLNYLHIYNSLSFFIALIITIFSNAFLMYKIQNEKDN